MAPRWVLAHEFGHNFQYNLQGNNLNGGGGSHSVCQLVSDVTAFQEGFADWHASFRETEGRLLYIDCVGGDCYSACNPGYGRENNVAAFFWDLFDAPNVFPYDGINWGPALDTVQYSLGILKSWTQYGTFPSFYSDYLNRGIWGANADVVNQLRTVNEVNVPY